MFKVLKNIHVDILTHQMNKLYFKIRMISYKNILNTNSTKKRKKYMQDAFKQKIRNFEVITAYQCFTDVLILVIEYRVF